MRAAILPNVRKSFPKIAPWFLPRRTGSDGVRKIPKKTPYTLNNSASDPYVT